MGHEPSVVAPTTAIATGSVQVERLSVLAATPAPTTNRTRRSLSLSANFLSLLNGGTAAGYTASTPAPATPSVGALLAMSIGSALAPGAFVDALKVSWHAVTPARHRYPQPDFVLVRQTDTDDDDSGNDGGATFYTPLHSIATLKKSTPHPTHAALVHADFNPRVQAVPHHPTSLLDRLRANLMRAGSQHNRHLPTSGDKLRSAIGTPSNFRHVVHLTSDIVRDAAAVAAATDSQSGNSNLDKQEYRLDGSGTTSTMSKEKVLAIWQQKIIPNWCQQCKSRTTIKLWRAGIPHECRSIVWRLAIGNSLHVTPDLFEIFHAHARSAAATLREDGQRNRALSSASLASSFITCNLISTPETDSAVLVPKSTLDEDCDDDTVTPPHSTTSRRQSAASSSDDDENFSTELANSGLTLGRSVDTNKTMTPPSSPKLAASRSPAAKVSISPVPKMKDTAKEQCQTRRNTNAASRIDHARSILGHEHSVVLIPIDLPRTVPSAAPIATTTSSSSSASLSAARHINSSQKAAQSSSVRDSLTEITVGSVGAHNGVSVASMDDIESPLGRMRAVLEAYVCYRPDVGYVQGMSYLASMLTGTGKDMKVYDMFVCLANMLHRPCLRTFYSMNVDKVQPYVVLHRKLLLEFLPALHHHFAAIDFSVEMYLYEWVLTLFAQVLPVAVSYRVWDCYFLFGDEFLLATTVGILQTISSHLLGKPFEDVATLLTRGVCTIAPLVDEETLFDNIDSVRSRIHKRYGDMLRSCERECARDQQRQSPAKK